VSAAAVSKVACQFSELSGYALRHFIVPPGGGGIPHFNEYKRHRYAQIRAMP